MGIWLSSLLGAGEFKLFLGGVGNLKKRSKFFQKIHVFSEEGFLKEKIHFCKQMAQKEKVYGVKVLIKVWMVKSFAG